MCSGSLSREGNNTDTMDTETVQTEKRKAFRIPAQGECAEVELVVGDLEIPARLLNESGGGFGLYVESSPPFKRDDIIEVRVNRGRYRARVAYVRPCDEDSRIQVVEQDESGTIQTVVNPGDRYCVGLERIEDLSFYRSKSKGGWLRRLLRGRPRFTAGLGNPVTLLSLIGCFVFPVVVFIAFAIAIQLHTNDSGSSISVRTRGGSDVTRNTPDRLSRRPKYGNQTTGSSGHSTESTATRKTKPRLSIEDVYRNSRVPITEEVKSLFRELFEEAEDHPAQPVPMLPGNAESENGAPVSRPPAAESDLSTSQLQALEKLAAEAQRRIENGANPSELKQELRGAIRGVLFEGAAERSTEGSNQR